MCDSRVTNEGKLTRCLRELRGQMPTLDACVWLGTLALTKYGSWNRVWNTGELTKMADINTPWKEPDVRSHRKFWAKHLKWKAGWVTGICREVCLPGGLHGSMPRGLPEEEGDRAGGAVGTFLAKHPDTWEMLGAELWPGMLSGRPLFFWKMILLSRVFWNWSGKAEGGRAIYFGVFLKGAVLNVRNLSLF